MKVLVSAASKYGATSEIAEEIGKTLREALRDRDVGVDDVLVEVRPAHPSPVRTQRSATGSR
jgi:menaquinone-dependent protoporphyrinogen IX oxidase